MNNNLVGTWRGRLEVYKYQGTLNVRIHSAEKQTRHRNPDGGFVSVGTGTYWSDSNNTRRPRNIRHYVHRDDGGFGTNAQWRVGQSYLADLNIRSERHCSVFLIENEDQHRHIEPEPTPQPEPEYAGCDECGLYHRFNDDCYDHKPDANGWAHLPTCSKVAAPSPEPEPKLDINAVPKRPDDPNYIERILKMCEVKLRSGHQKPVALIGPSQSGKTSLIEMIARQLGYKFHTNPFSLGLTERTIMGAPATTDKAGVFVWRDSQFVQAIENERTVYLADEFDAGDENCLLVFNTALAQGWMMIADRHDNPMAKRTLTNLVFAAMNTYGLGSNIYVGRNQLDASTRQRFNPIYIDYNPAWEWDIVYGDGTFPNVDRGKRDDLMATTFGVRKAIENGKLRQIWSTTNIHDAMGMMDAGFTLDDYMREQFMAWSDPERLVLTNNGVRVPDRA